MRSEGGRESDESIAGHSGCLVLLGPGHLGWRVDGLTGVLSGPSACLAQRTLVEVEWAEEPW